MHCPACGTEVRQGQKFCMECGQSLRGISDVTGEVPVVAGTRSTAETAETTELPTTRPSVDTPPDTTHVPPDTTHEMAATTRVSTPIPPPPPPDITGEYAAPEQPVWHAEEERRPRPGFRLRPLLLVAVVGAAAAVVGVLVTMIEITPAVATDAYATGVWKVNDFGTNNTVTALIAAGVMFAGALAWCFGFRWGAGLAGGAGAALAGWAALVIGLAEFPIQNAELAADLVPADITRDIGYWAVAGAGAVGLLVLILSFARAGNDGRSGLDPWIAALAAVSVLVATIGPLIPVGTADWSGNYSSASLTVDVPTALFAGRLIQLGLLAFCGVIGFLLVRRYGLGLAVGGAVAAGWLVATAATEASDSPIGLAYANPGAGTDLKPHAVTIVGTALVGFFALVAIVMALLDAER